MIAFQSGIPLPPPAKPGAKPGTKPKARIHWNKFLVGWSFFLEGCDTQQAHRQINGGRLRGYKFAVRATVEDGVPGARVWRVE